MGDEDHGVTLNAMGALVGDVQGHGRRLRVHRHHEGFLIVAYPRGHEPKMPEGLTPPEPESVFELNRDEIVALERLSDPMLIRQDNGEHIVALLREAGRILSERHHTPPSPCCDLVELAAHCLSCADALEHE